MIGIGMAELREVAEASANCEVAESDDSPAARFVRNVSQSVERLGGVLLSAVVDGARVVFEGRPAGGASTRNVVRLELYEGSDWYAWKDVPGHGRTLADARDVGRMLARAKRRARAAAE